MDTWLVRCALLASVAASVSACAPHRATAHELDAGATEPRTLRIAARTPYLATYPCGEQCHDARTPDATPRALVLFHARRRVAHGPAIHWCDDCHDLAHPDTLVSLDGETAIPFDASDQVCAQCHGERHRDWELGLHGITTGTWNGPTERRLCTACHDPHAPDRIHLEALPPPRPDPRSPEGPS